MNLNKSMKIGVFIIAVIILGITYHFFFSKNSDAPVYLTETAKLGTISQNVIASGTVRSNNRVEVGAQVSGKITKINVTLGQFVKKGELLAEIDSLTQLNDLEEAKSQLKSYEAQLKSASTKLKLAKSKFNRSKKLYTVKSISQDEYEEAEKELAVAESSLIELEELINQSKISVKTAETNLSYTTIISPIDGVVISIPVSEGQTVNSMQTTPTIVQVADLSKMLIKAEIPEGDITKITSGMKVEFTTLSEPETVYKSQIQSIDPADSTLTDDEYTESVSNTNAIYYYANIIIENPENKLRIGMTTTNTIKIAEKENVLIIPTMAISKKNNQFYVKVLEDNKVIETKIDIGISDDFFTEIKSGLNEGKKVITTQLDAGDAESMSSRPQRL